MTVRKLVAALAALLVAASAVLAGGVPADDAHVVAGSKKNYGNKPNLQVRTAKSEAYLKFNLSHLPFGTSGTDVTKATMWIWRAGHGPCPPPPTAAMLPIGRRYRG